MEVTKCLVPGDEFFIWTDSLKHLGIYAIFDDDSNPGTVDESENPSV